jgi:hypothetical protein
MGMLEHFQKNCSRAVQLEGRAGGAVFLAFGIVSAQSQGHEGHASSLSLAKKPKILAPRWLQFFFKRSRHFLGLPLILQPVTTISGARIDLSH